MTKRLRVLTWHVHGNYLYCLTHLPHDFIVPFHEDNRPGYARLGNKIPWGANVQMLAAEHIRDQKFDLIVYQSRSVYQDDRDQLLSQDQQKLPCVFIEHNPPEPHPSNTRHFFNHDKGTLVHVTHYNALMWDGGDMPQCVIEHGVPAPKGVTYTGELDRGIVVINNLSTRGRRLGLDLYEQARQNIPVDLIGMGSAALAGGQGEVPNMEVPAFIAKYRFFYTPIRYASLGLSVIEAMMVGLPVVGIAATELPHIIQNGKTGYVDRRPGAVLEVARELIRNPELARRWGVAAQRSARERFNIARFISDWNAVLWRTQEVENAERTI